MIHLPHPNLLPEPYMAQEKGLSILIFDHFDFCKILIRQMQYIFIILINRVRFFQFY